MKGQSSSSRIEVALDVNSQLIQRHWGKTPQAAIILGTGLGNLSERVSVDVTINYEELQDFPCTSAIGHRGRFLCGVWGGTDVLVIDGRCHFYEGHPASRVTVPVRLAARLGASTLIVTNASGGLNPYFQSGDVMAIADHINLMGARTASLADAGVAASRGFARELYDRQLLKIAQASAVRHGFVCHRGCYVAVLGPNYETRAEYRMMRRIGGDAVGMSTVPEVLAAAQCGLRVLGFSTITNVARPDAPSEVDAHDVIDIASTAEPKLRCMIEDVLSSIAAPRLRSMAVSQEVV